LTRKVTKTTAKKVVGFALDKKASDVALLDVRKITTVADFFIVCSGASDTQVKAIADNVMDAAKDYGLTVHHIEGYESLRWVLIDMSEIVVHVFKPDVRSYYQLERLWGDAPVERFGEDDEAAAS
jgi:ribosome-associated protein